jgi:hypothetical protein
VKLATVGVGAGPEGKGNYRQGPAPATTLPGGDESTMISAECMAPVLVEEGVW